MSCIVEKLRDYKEPHANQESRLDNILQWLSEVSLPNSKASFTANLYSCIRNLKDLHESQGTCLERKEDEVKALVCLLAASPCLPNQDKICQDLLDLCEQGALNKSLLYLAFAAREDPNDGLFTFVNEDRSFWGDDESLCRGLVHRNSHPLLELLLLSLNKDCHWFPYLLEVLAQLLNKNRRNLVEEFLSHPTFKPMWPIMLLYLVQKQSSLFALKVSTENCLQLENIDASIKRLAEYLAWQINVISTLKEKKLSFYVPVEFYTRNLSTLCLLHKSCDLISLGWETIHELLLESSEHVTLWELGTFNAFWASQLSFQSVLACGQSGIMTSSDYKEKVFDNFSKVQNILCQLEPLDLRIEVIEKIYSLLFLRYEDFHVDSYSDSDDGEEEGYMGVQSMKVSPQDIVSSSLTSLLESDANSKQRRKISSAPSSGISETRNDPLSVLPQHGFVCDRHVTRDLLKMLQYCIRKVQKSSEENEKSEILLKSAFVQNDLQHRVDRIAGFVSEALWRLEILTNAEFIQSVGRENDYGERLVTSLVRDTFSWYFRDKDSTSDDDSPYRQTALQGHDRSDPEKRSESGSHSNATLSNKVNHPGRRKSSMRSSNKCIKDPIIKKMLSEETSLLTQCLVRGDLHSAREVEKRLVQEEQPNPIVVELNFADAYLNFQQKLNVCAEEFNECSGVNYNSTLGAIHRAASAGIQASSLNNEVETLLTASALPCISNVDQLPPDFLQLLGGSPNEQPTTIAGADIALMLTTSAQQALNFLHIASKYSQELRNIQMSPTYRPMSPGFLPLVHCVFQALGVLDSMSPTALLHRWDAPSLANRHLKDSLQFQEEMKKFVIQVDTSQNFVILYPKLLQLISSFAFLRAEEIKHEYCNFQDFKTYLRTFLQVMSHNSAVLSGDGPLTEEHFALLEESPSKLLSSLVLNKSMLPEDVEGIASQLGCSLLPSLCAELCSPLPSLPPAKRPNEVTSKRCWHGAWVLNATESIGPARRPNDLVYELLQLAVTELNHQLKIEQNVSDSGNGYIPLSRVDDEKMLLLLNATWELAAVDINVLETGAEILVFYCNLATLMWIHCLIFLQSIGDRNVHALFRGSPFHQTAVLNSIAYKVGKLGVVTLWEVRRMALGQDLMDPAGTDALWHFTMRSDASDPFVLFVLPTSCRYSPKLQILKTENLEIQLQQSVKEYLSHMVYTNSNKIFVPRLISAYIRVTGQNMRTFLSSNCCSGSNDSLRHQLASLPEDAPIILLDDHIIEESIMIYYKKPMIMSLSNSTHKKYATESVLSLDENLLTYFKQKCPVIATLLQNLLSKSSNHERESGDELEEATEMDETSLLIGFPCLDRLCKTSETAILSHFYNDNTLLCALHDIVPDGILWKCLNCLAGERRWQLIVDLLNVLPEFQLNSDYVLRIVHDLSLMELSIESRGFGESWKYCEQISSLFLRAKHTFVEVFHWPGHICSAQLQAILQIPQLQEFNVLHEKAAQLKQSISMYQEILDLKEDAEWKTWQEVREVSYNDPEAVLHQILNHGKAELCILWMKLHHISSSHLHLIDNRVIALLLNAESPIIREAERLLYLLPLEVSLSMCLKALPSIHSIPGLKFCLCFLSDVCGEKLSHSERETVKLASFGVQMVELLPEGEQLDSIELVSKPHLMLEQLVMNMRLEAAERVLNKIRPELEKFGLPFPLAIPTIDCMLRQYAERALEFRIAQGSTTSHFSESSGFLISISSLSSKEFIMPVTVPTKSDWVPNEQASVCMICQTTAFSMFSRRHHCRRCGRVVCAQCSPHKMNVEGYGTLKVRVCVHCLSQTLLLKETKAQLSDEGVVLPSSKLSSQAECNWRLSCSSSLNETIRGEFGYENAPSVSLCLSILNLHSKSAACPNFLVDSCETILNYLQPRDGIPNPEIDYGFVIEMCRSLVLAAKVKCAQWGYTSDEPNCDQRLSKIDLIGLLISYGCAALIPPDTRSHELRRLQAQLLEEELWELALEVSTKGGMERSGVWSAWGKGCLRAGRWRDAREKFAHCLPDKRSAADPPLLLEILQILEGTHYSMDKEILQKAEIQRSDGRLAPCPAVAVLHTLASLKNVSQGKFAKIADKKDGLEPLVYAECSYYLQKYGSHSSYLRFLIHHSDLKEASLHVLAHSVDPQLFFEWVYKPCLKMGRITALHSSMTAIDPSLCVWKTYINGICAALERHSLLHTLYEVQQWSKDHVRAAMTCIRFYHQNARSYSDLYFNISHLMRAQSHLEAAHAVSSVPGKVTKSGSGSSSVSSTEMLETETLWLQLSPKKLDHHLSTVWRQIELTKFLRNCELNGQHYEKVRPLLPQSIVPPVEHKLPTLFGNLSERKILAALCMLCGKNIEEGFGIAFRIMEGFNINAQDVYEAVAIVLHRSRRLSDIQQLIECIRSSGITNPTKVCDHVLYACISQAPEKPDSNQLDVIIRNITDSAVKISAFIVSGQLKSAYLLAVKHNRSDYIERILEEADRSGQTAIKAICLKRLGRS